MALLWTIPAALHKQVAGASSSRQYTERASGAAKMDEDYELSEWNKMHIDLNQSLLGALSGNVRMVSFGRDGQKWLFEFYVATEDEADLEEIEDAMVQLDAFYGRSMEREVRLIVERGAIDWPEPPTRVVFRRRDEG